ncbi:hypothetical protein RHSP_17951 [Rhizobium freirei PRF 81]|uniref:Uncharacterized protein n=1 Tax=Rhizobium freirei PRF 81 TaxID=363754 RepID=N6UYM2_9HYPH|nr:hypothetical protein RHSP_17951 [Rhizobium freirei PRF 81]
MVSGPANTISRPPARGLKLFFRQLPCHIHRKIGEDAVTAGALEGKQGFEHYLVAVDPSVGGRGLDHRVFAGDLIGESGKAEGLLQPPTDIEIGQAGLDHQHVGAFLDVERGVTHGLGAVGRIDVIGLLVALQQAAGRNRLAIGAVEGRAEFRRIAHDADVLVAGGVECLADRTDASVHHFRGRDDVGTCVGLIDRRPRHLLDRFVVDDFVAAQDAVMAVTGEGVEGDVGDDADVRHGLLDRRAGKIDEVVLLEAVRAGLVAQRHFDVREGGKRWNAEIGRFLRRFHGLVHRHAVDAGHGGNGLQDAGAGNEKDRPDQIVDRQPVFLHEAARPVGLAVASHAAMSGDLVNEMRLVFHDAAILFRL